MATPQLSQEGKQSAQVPVAGYPANRTAARSHGTGSVRRQAAGVPNVNAAPSINRSAAASKEPAANGNGVKPEVRGPQNEPFTESQLNLMWDAYIGANPTAHILVNTMRTSRPKLIEPTRFVVAVENDKQVETMNAASLSLLSYLRGRLRNDSLTFEVIVNEGEASPRTWNSREVFQHILESNEAVKEFVEKFKMNLL